MDSAIEAGWLCDKEGCEEDLSEDTTILVAPGPGKVSRFCCYAHLHDWAKQRMYEESGLDP